MSTNQGQTRDHGLILASNKFFETAFQACKIDLNTLLDYQSDSQPSEGARSILSFDKHESHIGGVDECLESEVSKHVLARIRLKDTSSEEAYLILDLKVAIALSGIMAMKLTGQIAKQVEKLELQDTDENNLTEIVNIITGSLNKSFRKLFSEKNLHLKLQGTSIVETTDLIGENPVCNGTYLIGRTSVNIPKFTSGRIHLLLSTKIAEGFLNTLSIPNPTPTCTESVPDQPETSDPTKPKVLIVDDSHVIRSTLKRILSDRFSVLELDSGERIYDLIKETKVDLIILDVLLPGESGLHICKRLKNHEQTSHIPILMCSSVGDKKNVLEALRNDADGFIMKPFTSKALIAKLRNLHLF